MARERHCHVKKGFIQDVGYGVVRHPQTMERVKICRWTGDFDVTSLTAFGIARRVFKIAENAESSGLFSL